MPDNPNYIKWDQLIIYGQAYLQAYLKNNKNPIKQHINELVDVLNQTSNQHDQKQLYQTILNLKFINAMGVTTRLYRDVIEIHHHAVQNSFDKHIQKQILVNNMQAIMHELRATLPVSLLPWYDDQIYHIQLTSDYLNGLNAIFFSPFDINIQSPSWYECCFEMYLTKEKLEALIHRCKVDKNAPQYNYAAIEKPLLVWLTVYQLHLNLQTKLIDWYHKHLNDRFNPMRHHIEAIYEYFKDDRHIQRVIQQNIPLIVNIR